MKRCPICKKRKQDSEFRPSPTTGKLQAYCTPCHRAYYKDYMATRPDKSAERSRRYRLKYWDKTKLANYTWRKANPDKWKAINKRWRDKNRKVYLAKRRELIRQEVFEAYGGFICVCCGEQEPKFLTIDHINNDGAKHRKELKGKGGTAFLAWLRSRGFPSGFQVLCFNCNCGRARNGGVCPHHGLEGSTTRAQARSSKAIVEQNARGPYLQRVVI